MAEETIFIKITDVPILALEVKIDDRFVPSWWVEKMCWDNIINVSPCSLLNLNNDTK